MTIRTGNIRENGGLFHDTIILCMDTLPRERFESLKPVPDTMGTPRATGFLRPSKKGHATGARGRRMRAAWLRRALGLLALALAADAVLTKPSKLTTCA